MNTASLLVSIFHKLSSVLVFEVMRAMSDSKITKDEYVKLALMVARAVLDTLNEQWEASHPGDEPPIPVAALKIK